MVRCAIGPCRSDGWIKPGTETRLIRPGHFDEQRVLPRERGEQKARRDRFELHLSAHGQLHDMKFSKGQGCKELLIRSMPHELLSKTAGV